MQLVSYIISYTQLPETSVKNTVELLHEACTIPFISRYRKERTGNLDEVQIGDIVKYKEQFETLEKRKITILKALEDQDVISAELRQKIEATQDITALEDIYLPYKKSRKTKAETARKNGLEPLAKIIMSQNASDVESIAHKYIKGDISSAEDALEGARHIISEWINERTDIRNNIRQQLERFAMISTKVVKSKKDDEAAQKFRDYFEWEESLSRIPSHRLLAILRAEKEGFIKSKISIDDEKALFKIEDRILKSRNACASQIQLAIQDAYKRLLFPSLSNEALQNAKEKADASAISVFAKNLKQLLLGSPLGEKRVLAIDPGFRTGCKIVCLDAQANLPRSNSAMARSWLKIGNKTDWPQPGDIVVFWRTDINGIFGHVGFFLGYTKSGKSIYCLGGNQNDEVNIQTFPLDRILEFRSLTDAVDESLTIPTGYLRKGDSNENVKLLQKILIKLDYLNGHADGVFGPKTEQALIKFQTDSHIFVDGIYGSESRNALQDQLNS